MKGEPLRPGLAVSQPDAEPIHIPHELARELIEDDPAIGREWRRWRARGGGRGLVILLRPDVLDRVRDYVTTTENARTPGSAADH